MLRLWPFGRHHVVYDDDDDGVVDYDALEYAGEFSDQERRSLEGVHKCEKRWWAVSGYEANFRH